jgi:predicted metalloprotease
MSSNIEDRRGMRAGGGFRLGPGMFGGGSGGGFRMGRGGGIGGIGLILVVLAVLFFGGGDFLGGGGSDPAIGPGPQSQGTGAPPSDEQAQFVSVVVGYTEDTWNAIFQGMNRDYQEPRLVMFTDAVDSACGFASAASGPFYCPLDQKVYLDLGFFNELAQRFGAPGDFAQAYVIAHEVGHHVQRLLGTSEEVRAAQQQVGEAEANDLSVRLELQADCYAGVWANHADAARQILEQGDTKEAMDAAAAIGDDRLQRRSQGYVVPESFTHGTSAQRAEWFNRGLTSGRLADCDTFQAADL